MIRVKPPDVPEKLPKAAEDELKRLKEKLDGGDAITTTDFKAYKTAGVRDGLNAGFGFKCAYCESFFGATQPVAIEHYRPKAKVTTEQGDKPGYYWLAARWANLLPSCTDCNSPRQQEMAGVRVTVGKGNQFPIANEDKRAQRRGRGAQRAPPAAAPLPRPPREAPGVRRGRHRAAAPDLRAQSSKGAKSIAVYALLRPKLVDARKERQADIQGVMNVVAREARAARGESGRRRPAADPRRGDRPPEGLHRDRQAVLADGQADDRAVHGAAARMTDLAAADYSAPTRECDIVMKGGITSGVVYPHAICELAQTYRFVQVGGTSAGAIAAAATAAAELGRAQGGFRELAALPSWLGGGRHLKELFQPEPATEGLFRMMIAALEHKRSPRRCGCCSPDCGASRSCRCSGRCPASP